jgi:hypothetical protein
MAVPIVPKRGKLGKRQWVGTSLETNDKSLEGAIADAYNQARHARPKGKLQFKVDDIYVIGTNPLSEYVVVLGVI